jgi:hypothetical protein
LNLAYEIEKRRAERGDYPPDWPIIATRVKALAGWRCERCHVPHNEDKPDGTMLTVHHLDGNKWNCEDWNLAALCQRCHLRVQAKVVFYRVPEIYDWESNTYRPLTTHTLWMARHIKSYNAWAFMEDRPQIPISRIVERDYDREWPRPVAAPADDFDLFHRPDGSEVEIA